MKDLSTLGLTGARRGGLALQRQFDHGPALNLDFWAQYLRALKVSSPQGFFKVSGTDSGLEVSCRVRGSIVMRARPRGVDGPELLGSDPGTLGLELRVQG